MSEAARLGVDVEETAVVQVPDPDPETQLPEDPQVSQAFIPPEIPGIYRPRKSKETNAKRAGRRYKAYNAGELDAAIRAVRDEGLSLRQASLRYKVPKTTLAEKLGPDAPRLPAIVARDHNKNKTRFSWAEDDMAKAAAAVLQGGATVSDSARQFGVPPSALNSRTRGRPPRELKAELAKLTLKQETLMVDWALALGELGFPPTKDQIYTLANCVVRRDAADGGGGDHARKDLGKQWVGHWLRRHPDVQALDWWHKLRPEQAESFGAREFAMTFGAAVSTEQVSSEMALPLPLPPTDPALQYDQAYIASQFQPPPAASMHLQEQQEEDGETAENAGELENDGHSSTEHLNTTA